MKSVTWVLLSNSALPYRVSRLGRPRSFPANFFEHGAAALTDRGIVLVFAHVD